MSPHCRNLKKPFHEVLTSDFFPSEGPTWPRFQDPKAAQIRFHIRPDSKFESPFSEWPTAQFFFSYLEGFQTWSK
jgi:hypothetical protein